MTAPQLPIRILRDRFALAIGLECAVLPVPALAQTAAPVDEKIKQLQSEIRNTQKHYETEIRNIQKQHATEIRNLQRQLDDLKAAQAAPKPAPIPPTAGVAPAPGGPAPLQMPPTAGVLPPSAPAAPPPPPAVAEAKRGGWLASGIDLTLGGYIEAASIYRTRNETADISSNFNTAIPFPNSPNYHLTELRFSAHQTRLSLLGQGKVDPDTAFAGYVESDFQSAPADSNSIESNSYTPRLRQAYATLDRKDLGFHLLGGQVYTLLTMFNHDMTPRQEDIPLTIDGQYVVGFTWTRNPQFRVVQDLDKAVSVGFSLESPQALLFSGPNPPLVPTTVSNPGGNHLNPLAQYSTDIAPDMVAKMVIEPGWGHYELYGIGRLFRSRAAFANRTIWGGGGGAGAILPLVPKQLDLQADFLYGDGIGRYGTSQLPDVAIKPTGILAPVPGLQALVGLIDHPTDALDLYVYGGLEQAGQTSFTVNGTRARFPPRPSDSRCFYPCYQIGVESGPNGTVAHSTVRGQLVKLAHFPSPQRERQNRVPRRKPMPSALLLAAVPHPNVPSGHPQHPASANPASAPWLTSAFDQLGSARNPYPVLPPAPQLSQSPCRRRRGSRAGPPARASSPS
jgi:hypothetical protein